MKELDRHQLNLVFEDQYLLVINKPACVHSVGISQDKFPSIAQQLIKYLPKLAEASPKTLDAGLVNRLDFETSGLMLAAKTKRTWASLRAMLMRGAVHKKYLIVVEGKFPLQIQVKGFIGSKQRSAKRVTLSTTATKRFLPAITRFKRLKYLPALNLSLVQAQADVARRHQIRAHAMSLKHPLAGDKLYSSKINLQELLGEDAPPFLLHAAELALSHPLSAKSIKFTLENELIGQYFGRGTGF